MKARDFFRTKWNYILIFILPWLMILLHSVIRDSWLTGGGSILAKDAGNLYVEMYSQLWDVVHTGESLAFNWNSGLGMEFGLNILRYLNSPFTLVMLVIPKSWIVNAVQVLVVLKWSLLSVSILFYLSKTKSNNITKCKSLVNVTLAIAYMFSNMAIFNLANLATLDVMILFPILLLLVENIVDGKRIKLFACLLIITVLCNYQLALAVIVFLIFWYVIRIDKKAVKNKKNIICVSISYLIAIAIGVSLIWICGKSDIAQVESGNKMIMSISELIQRLFFCDSLSLAQMKQPMLYCSIVVTVLAVYFLCVKTSVMEKIMVIILFVLLSLGVLTESGNWIWNGTTDLSVNFVFLLTILMIYVALQTMIYIKSIKKWHVICVTLCIISAIVFGFFNASLFLDFYVYLGTLLIAFFISLMLFFYLRKSIQYHNLLKIICLVCIFELSYNAYYQLEEYNMYSLNAMYYNAQSQELTDEISLQSGERVAITQTVYNNGLLLDIPDVSQDNSVMNGIISDLYKRLGLAWSEEGSEYVGGSPLLNLMFNVRYGMSQSEIAFSDVTMIKSEKGYNLYETNRLAGVGYVVNDDVINWQSDLESPFDVQNDFVKKATGKENIFNVCMPEVTCSSLTGISPHKNHYHEGEECDEECESEIYYGEYLEDGRYYYQYRKMYSEDMANMMFISDGVSDYYVFAKGTSESYFMVKIGETYTYIDQLPSEQKMLHIGVVPEGEKITISANALVDDIVTTQITYEVASFNEEVYQDVYSDLSSNVLQLDTFENGVITGRIYVENEGIMMTSIPALDRFRVYVDGEEISYESIGDALIGVPVTFGEHEIEIKYDFWHSRF